MAVSTNAILVDSNGSKNPAAKPMAMQLLCHACLQRPGVKDSAFGALSMGSVNESVRALSACWSLQNLLE